MKNIFNENSDVKDIQNNRNYEDDENNDENSYGKSMYHGGKEKKANTYNTLFIIKNKSRYMMHLTWKIW